MNNSVSRIATLEQIRVARERIGRRLGVTVDVLEVLDKSRESHPWCQAGCVFARSSRSSKN